MKDFELAKYHNRWAVYGTKCRCFFFIGESKKFCKRKVQELNHTTV